MKTKENWDRCLKGGHKEGGGVREGKKRGGGEEERGEGRRRQAGGEKGVGIMS